MQQQKPAVQILYEKKIARLMLKFGGSEAITRFIARHGKLTTKTAYLNRLDPYIRWLNERGVTMSPDELVQDNLNCIFKSDATDVRTKRKHTDWLSEFVNGYQVRRGIELNTRKAFAATIREFYQANDSPLFGDFSVASETTKEPPRPLEAEDIRQVLNALPLQVRTPLLCAWQSGAEINRVLGLRWKMILDETGHVMKEDPLRLDFFGRKRHMRRYFTFFGRDSVQHLRAWRATWSETAARDPEPDDLIFIGKRAKPQDQAWLNAQMKRAARRLHSQGLVKNGNPGSWHPHALRHSFKTEAEHAGTRSAIVEFWMGHEGGIVRVYDERDEIHPEDFGKAYRQFEPCVSLDYTQVTARAEYENREKMLLSRVLQLEKDYEELKRELLSKQRTQRPSSQEGT